MTTSLIILSRDIGQYEVSDIVTEYTADFTGDSIYYDTQPLMIVKDLEELDACTTLFPSYWRYMTIDVWKNASVFRKISKCRQLFTSTNIGIDDLQKLSSGDYRLVVLAEECDDDDMIKAVMTSMTVDELRIIK